MPSSRICAVAIERNEIEVVYQPIPRLSDMQLAGFEALVRWRHRTEGLGPDVFMSVAEETGIIKDLSHHVLNEAARQLGNGSVPFAPTSRCSFPSMLFEPALQHRPRG